MGSYSGRKAELGKPVVVCLGIKIDQAERQVRSEATAGGR
jgi:hypothetical protein